MNRYSVDRIWTNGYIPDVKRIITPYLPHMIIDAPEDRDREQATDLVVLVARETTIGVRLRRWDAGYWRNFGNQFTIRSQRDSGAKTELEKIKDGWGDWLFYGHAGQHGIDPWMLIDLNALRVGFARNSYLLQFDDPACTASGRQSNGDGTHFVWIDRSLLPVNVTVATSDNPTGWNAAPLI